MGLAWLPHVDLQARDPAALRSADQLNVLRFATGTHGSWICLSQGSWGSRGSSMAQPKADARWNWYVCVNPMQQENWNVLGEHSLPWAFHTMEPLEDDKWIDWILMANVLCKSWSTSWPVPSPFLSYRSCLNASFSMRTIMFLRK